MLNIFSVLILMFTEPGNMLFYDPDHVRAVPLPEIAERLGLNVRDGLIDCLAHWGNEKVSCSLSEDDNYFRCACGNSGWATDLVSQALGTDVVEAIEWIGSEFNLTPIKSPKKTDYMSRSRGYRPLRQAKDKELPDELV